MAFKIGVGKSDFASLRLAKEYYVDKTEIIYELVEETGHEATLFTRPRRFGKTLMLSMMRNFFDRSKDSKELFQGLKIIEHREFCDRWMNQYPVLFLSLKDVEAEDFPAAYEMLQIKIADTCKENAGLLDAEGPDEDDRKVFLRLKAQDSSQGELKNSLKMIMRMMYAAYGRKTILFMDEYDVPLAKASEKDSVTNRFYLPMLDMIKGILGTALKDNEFLAFAVVTGCLRIAKESIFTETNNFASYSVLDPDFSGYFGFSEVEVREMLSAAGREGSAGVMKEWYDGYVFGDSYVYCPWDVMNYMSALQKRKTAKPKNYWKNTSHNGILRTFVERTDFDVSDKFEALMNGGTVTQTVSDELTYNTLHASEENLWSILLMTGYVTKADAREDGETVSLKIPNREIASIFEDAVVEHFKDTVDMSVLHSLIKALWEGNEAGAAELISDLLWNTISYNDYHEDYYHAFLAGIFVGRGYEVASNKEKGLGRPDILLKDRKNRRAIIIETKKSRKESNMDADCQEAVRQIVTRKYAEGLLGYGQVFCYGIAFFQKKAKVLRFSGKIS